VPTGHCSDDDHSFVGCVAIGDRRNTPALIGHTLGRPGSLGRALIGPPLSEAGAGDNHRGGRRHACHTGEEACSQTQRHHLSGCAGQREHVPSPSLHARKLEVGGDPVCDTIHAWRLRDHGRALRRAELGARPSARSGAAVAGVHLGGLAGPCTSGARAKSDGLNHATPERHHSGADMASHLAMTARGPRQSASSWRSPFISRTSTEGAPE
jgi:hypothetical protein